MKNTIKMTLLLVMTTACIKTAEQVQREKRVESMSEQLKDSQGLVAETVETMKDLQTQLNKLNGRIEELEHRQAQGNPETAQMNESMVLIKSQQETQSNQLMQIQNELKDQRMFIEKVTASLGALHSESAPRSKKKSVKQQLSAGLELIKNDKFAEAKDVLEALIDHENLSAGDKNKVLFGLGKIEYYLKNYDKGLVYFSKIYTKFPKATLAPASLLFIGRSLDRLGKKDEAKEALAQVSEQYPGTKEAAEAKKEI
jgi:TolA-binding protein